MGRLTTMRNDKYLTKIIAASLLGDGSVSKLDGDNTNSRFVLNQIETHRDYLEYMKVRLEELTPCHLDYMNKHSKVAREVEICGVKTVANPALALRTRRHPFYTKFRQRMYPNGFKVVDPHYLTLVDWEFLAIWYMEDGTASKQTIKSTTYMYPQLLTLNFSYGDNLLLKRVLKEKLDLEWNIKQISYKSGIKYFLVLRGKDVAAFNANIREYVAPSFQYKLM